MQCLKCNCEAVINNNRTIFNQEEGKLYREMTFACRNRRCSNFEKVIKVEREEIPVSIE